VRVEDQVDFRDVRKEGVKHFNEHLNQIKGSQFALFCVNHKNERQSGIVSVDYSAIRRDTLTVGDEVCKWLPSLNLFLLVLHLGIEFFDDLVHREAFGLKGVFVVELLQTHFAC